MNRANLLTIEIDKEFDYVLNEIAELTNVVISTEVLVDFASRYFDRNRDNLRKNIVVDRLIEIIVYSDTFSNQLECYQNSERFNILIAELHRLLCKHKEEMYRHFKKNYYYHNYNNGCLVMLFEGY